MTDSLQRRHQPDRRLRRLGLPLFGHGLALVASAALLAACGPDEPAGLNRPGSTAVADAEGNVGIQGTTITPDSWTVTGAYLAGLTAFDDRDMGTAADLLTIALGEELKDPTLAQKTLFALLSDSRIADAVALAKRMHDAGFKSALISVALIQDQVRAGKFDAALATARELPDDRLMSVTAPMLRAWLALGASGQQAALDELKPLEAIDGADMLHQVQAALIYDHEGNDAKAVESLQKAIDSTTQMPAQLAEFYVKLMLRQGKPDAAREMVERFRAQTQGRGEDVASAMLRQIEAGKRNGPVVADVKEGMAIAYGEIAMELMADDFSGDALWMTQLALDLDPKLDIARVALGDLYRQIKRWDEAIAAYSQVQRDSIYHRPAQLSIAECYRLQEKNADAEAMLRKVIDEDPKDISAAQQLGQLLRSTKNFTGAAKAYSVAIDRLGTPGPEDWQLFYYRGIANERAKDWAPAEKDFLKALELSPDEPFVLNYLAYTWVERRERLDQALPMLEKAVKARPDEGFIVDSLGWAHFMLGHYDEAVKHLEKAVQLAPTDPVLNDHLGDAYWKVGRKNEARFQWSRAISFKPEEDLLPAIEKKLQDGMPDQSANPAVAPSAGTNSSSGG
jgi:tetratricopeptide (TPR) repeat protein